VFAQAVSRRKKERLKVHRGGEKFGGGKIPDSRRRFSKIEKRSINKQVIRERIVGSEKLSEMSLSQTQTTTRARVESLLSKLEGDRIRNVF